MKFYRVTIQGKDYYLDIDEMYDFLNAYPNDISDSTVNSISEEEYYGAIELEDISEEYGIRTDEKYFDEDGDVDIEMDKN